uniref:Dipeptidase n=1 Tax=Anopheles coluzzii TaxID=1518534 RepID=A0A8W7PTW6_ANOCL
MNRVGIMVDLSHVGGNTSREAILESKKTEHPRNKSDEELRFIADHGGFIGVTMFPPFLKRGIEATVDDYVEAMDYIINLVGEDCVGYGTDFTQGYDKGFFDWITHDKGRHRRLTNFGTILNPEGIRTIGETPNLTAAMEKAGWSEGKIRKVLGENWLRNAMLKRQFLALLLAGVALPFCSQAADKPTIKIGYVEGWSDSVATTNVAANIIRNKLGYPVEMVPVAAGIMWQGVARGDLDATLSAWLPTTHEAYYTQFKDKVVDVAVNYPGAKIGLIVPDYVAAHSIADLNANKAAFQGRIVGIDAGAG